MAINPTGLHRQLVREFSSDTGDLDFKADFVAAVNRSLDDMSESRYPDSAIGHVSGTDDPITELDEKHSAILHDLVAYYLVDGGRKHVQDDYATSFDRYNTRLGDYVVMLSQDDQRTRDDDGVPTEDIIGLGYLGDD